MNNNRVMIIGTLPPPVGGVTIHTLRLISNLEIQKYGYEFIDLRQKNKKNKIKKMKYIKNLLKILNNKNCNTIHYQLNNIEELALIIIINMFKRKKIITTVHSFRPETFNSIKKTIFSLIKQTNIQFIAPSQTIHRSLVVNGIKEKNIKILNTFLPPSDMEINEKLPDKIMEFLDDKHTIIVANASKLYKDKFDIDVYGLDMCIETCKIITKSKFIFCVPVISDLDYYEECIDKIKEYKIEHRFMIVNQSISLVALFKYTDIFIRPTSTDSFGVSVAEALTMGIPAIASDVCERAEGAMKFKSRDLDDLVEKINYTTVIKKYNNKYKDAKEYIKYYIKDYIKIYN